MDRQFRNRDDAGRQLAAHFEGKEYDSSVVVALPRGGVPVAYPVAKALSAPLDILLVGKLGAPGNEELAMGAVAEGDFAVVNTSVVDAMNIPDSIIEQVITRKRKEMLQHSRMYRGNREPIPLHDKTAILVDDGLATGSTMRVALDAVKSQGPRRIIVAVPVAPPETCEELGENCDEVVCVLTPRQLMSVGHWYEDFSQTNDWEVRDLDEKAERFAVARSNDG